MRLFRSWTGWKAHALPHQRRSSSTSIALQSMPNDHESTLTPSVLTQFLELDHFWRRGRVFTDAKKCFVPKLAKFDFHAFLWRLTVSEEKFSLMFQSSILLLVLAAAAKNNTKKKRSLGRSYSAWAGVTITIQGTAKLAIQGRYNRQQLLNPKPKKKNDTPCLLCNKKTFQGWGMYVTRKLVQARAYHNN